MTSEPRRPVVILMADDDEDDRRFVQKAWEKSRVANELHLVEDGEELMDYLYERGSFSAPRAAPRPGLILLDLNMPKKDGREALREIKADATLQQIPVVVLTTSQSEEDIYRTYDLGACLFITKPVTFGGLLAVIEALGTFSVQIVELPAGNAPES
jgi:DNA-binding response OmpR family regulator